MLKKILGVWAITSLFMLVGCNKNNSGEPTETTQATTAGQPAATPAAAKTYHLAFITNNSSDFWTIARAGCMKAQEDLKPNVDVDFQIPGDGTAAQQKRIVDDLLARGVDGISISPVDPSNQTDMLNSIASRALLFCHDSDAPKSNRVCYVGTDNVAAGRQAGGLIKEALPNGGKIMLFVGTLDAQNAKDRYNGIKEALAGSNIQILDVRTDDADHARAKSNAQDTLVKYPDLSGMMGLWSYNGPAIVSAVKEANKQGQVKIVCFDEEDDTLAGVKDGSIYATVVQQPYEFGHLAITDMYKYLTGDKSVVPASHQIYIPTLAIRKDNVVDFQTKLNVLRGRK
ncbi:MAG TPA: sugar-binding protein [Tepidisphaeraceae bacterium]|jgi:ribose transport system substrate-binding protein